MPARVKPLCRWLGALLLATAVVPAWAAVAAQPMEDSPQQAYLPYLAGSRSFIRSGVQVQNLDTRATVAVTMPLHAQTGGHSMLDLGQLGAGAAANVLVSDRVQDESAAIISASGPVGAIVRHDWPRMGNGAAIYNDASAATELHVPLAVKDFVHQCSLFTAQNTDRQSTAEVQLLFRAMGESDPLAQAMLHIALGTSLSRDLCGPGFASVPAGFVGSMELRSDVPVAAQTMI
jgi:hypothetical protein